jgi:hypothetical protein
MRGSSLTTERPTAKPISFARTGADPGAARLIERAWIAAGSSTRTFGCPDGAGVQVTDGIGSFVKRIER